MRKYAAAVTPRFCNYADSFKDFVPNFYGKRVGVGSCILFKRVEIATFKSRIVKTLPKSEKLNNITAS